MPLPQVPHRATVRLLLDNGVRLKGLLPLNSTGDLDTALPLPANILPTSRAATNKGATNKVATSSLLQTKSPLLGTSTRANADTEKF